MSDSQTILGKSILVATLISGVGAVAHGLWQPNRYIKAIAAFIGGGAGVVYYFDLK